MLTGNRSTTDRKQKRFDMVADVELLVEIRRASKKGEPIVRAKPLDVSPNGIKLVTSEAIGFGERIELKIAGANKSDIEFEFSADVRWIRQAEGTHDWTCGCSIAADCTNAWFQELASAGFVERRELKRNKTNAVAQIKFAGDPRLLDACVLDYSSHGFCLASGEAIGIDRPLEILIHQGNSEPIKLRAQSRWEVPLESGFMVGCELSPADRNTEITDWVEAPPASETQLLEENTVEFDPADAGSSEEEELVLDTQPLLELIEDLVDDCVSDSDDGNCTAVIGDRMPSSSATQPMSAFSPLPVHKPKPTGPFISLDEPAEEVVAKEEKVNDGSETQAISLPDQEPALLPASEPMVEEAPADESRDDEVLVEKTTAPEPASQPKPVAKQARPRGSLFRSIVLFVAIELMLGGYFGAFYLNWDRSGPVAEQVTDAPRSYRYFQRASEIVFYPAEVFESLF